jgi:hypothetical protein
MKRLRILGVWALLLSAIPAGSAAYGQMADHLYWGVIAQSHVYDDPLESEPIYVFLLELETSPAVDRVEFATPGGWAFTISNEPFVEWEFEETYHESYGDFDVWGYAGYFPDPGALDDFGDGLYTITLHYADGRLDQTDVWYGEPGTDYAIAQPLQRPQVLTPPYDAGVPSPVTFTWEAVTDPAVYDIYLAVTGPGNQAVIDEIYDVDTTGADPNRLDEGRYDAELAFENFWPIYNVDDIPFDLVKATLATHPFEVLYNTVYRFWSPLTGRHFYTADPAERDHLIDQYAYAWTYEGDVFYAYATPYDDDLAPVHRFWSDATSSHFYTISEAEKDFVIETYPDVWTYEGVAFYAYPDGAAPPATRPVHRFWNAVEGGHFYTMDEAEKDAVIDKFSHVFVYEGIAFYCYD